MMLAARMAALSRRLQSSASSTSGPKRRVRGEACVRYVLSRPLAGLEGRPAPCLRNPIKKSELEVCCQTSCKLHSLRLLDAQLSRGGGPVIAAPVRAESEPPNAAAAPNTTGAPKGKKSVAGSTEPNRSSRHDKGTQPHRSMARQRQTGSYTWTQVKSVQNLIERCLSQYMTQAEVRGPVSGIGVLRCLHAIDATRFHQTRSWVVSFSILRSFGPRRETRHSTRPHAGHRDAAGPG